MKKNFAQLIERDLAMACILAREEDEAIEFFLKGLRESAEQAERAAKRAQRLIRK